MGVHRGHWMDVHGGHWMGGHAWPLFQSNFMTMVPDSLT